MSQFIQVENQVGYRLVILNRYEKRNAINAQMYTQLSTVLSEAMDDEHVHSVILTGHAQCFTAGSDLHDFLDTKALTPDHPIIVFLNTCAQFSKPLIVGACGCAVGIGATILLHSDYVILGEETHIQMPFIHLGLVPEFASSLLLPERVGLLRANEMLLLGKSIDAQTALQWNLANEVLANDCVLEQCQQIAQQFHAQPLQGLLASKKLIRGSRINDLQKRISEEAVVFAKQLQEPETRARLQKKMG